MKILDNCSTHIVSHPHQSCNPLSPKNFTLVDNEAFVGVGERTNYVDHPINHTEGFEVLKDTDLHHVCGKRTPVLAGTRVFITRPGKLVRGKDIGASNSTYIFTQVSLESSCPSKFHGYAAISAIKKPARVIARVLKGDETQRRVLASLQHNLEQEVELVSIAPKSSRNPDLVVLIGGIYQQFEIKGSQNPAKSHVTVYDKSTGRDSQHPELEAFAQTHSNCSFVELVDRYRTNDLSVGFPGDPGVVKSGKLPNAFKITSAEELSKFRQMLLDRFAVCGDNYFTIVNHSRPEESLTFFTGHGINVLNAPLFPELGSFAVDTYGGPSSGKMRTGIKIRFKE